MPVSGDEAARRVDAIANGLLALGVGKGDAFAILAATSLEWCLFDFALGLIGAIGAPIYANSSPHDCAYVLDHSESVGVLVEDDEQRAKVDEARAGLPRLRHVLTFADLPELEASGRAYAAEHPDALDRAVAQVGEDDLFTYIYTSGTTGPPKACMIRHRNYYEMAAVLDGLPGLVEEADTMLLYLPLAHNFGRLMHLEAAYAGFTLAPLPRPAARRGGPRRGQADRLPERAAGVREGACGSPRPLRRGERAPPPARRVGAARRPARRAASARPAVPSPARSRAACGSPTGWSTRR